MNLDEASRRFRFPIRDRDRDRDRDREAKFTAAFDTAFTAIDIQIIKTPVRARGPTPSPNASSTPSAASSSTTS